MEDQLLLLLLLFVYSYSVSCSDCTASNGRMGAWHNLG